MGYLLLTKIPHGTKAPFAETFGTVMAFVPPLIALVAALFVVVAYDVDGTELGVQRLLWSTRIPLTGIAAAWHDPNAMKCSLRLFGNGGLYSITGLFRSKALGSYRAYVTDPGRAVVLRLPDRTVVVSPDDPGAFLEGLRAVFPRLDGAAAPGRR
ncbi:MAG: hypothetical protein HY825_01440 [Acidobacteria bacterium]|nr:hypothetical protein [Acidobacteriota bacterium]